jgi:hypothetical protein
MRKMIDAGSLGEELVSLLVHERGARTDSMYVDTQFCSTALLRIEGKNIL